MTLFDTPITLTLTLEVIGTILSIAGAELVSRNSKFSPWGWAAWLVANVVMMGFAWINNHYGLMLMQAWFFKTSFTGSQKSPDAHAGKAQAR